MDPADHEAPHATRRGWWAVAALLAAGSGIQLALWQRAVWLYRDQVELLTLGWQLAEGGGLAPFGKLMTGGYPVPGVLLQLLIGLPLEVWPDYRAPGLLLVGVHLAAGLVLARMLGRDFGAPFAALYLAVLWLSPWRLYHSGFLWEANYLLLPAAAHLAACRALAEQPRRGPSWVLGLLLVLTPQLHASFPILWVATLLLWWRGRLRPRPWPALAGMATAALGLLPTAAALLAGESPPRPEAAAGWLERLNSAQKALVYWFRFGSLDVGRRYRETVLCGRPGGTGVAGGESPAGCLLADATQVVALASVAAALVAGWWLWRHSGARSSGAIGWPEPPGACWGWYRAYALALLAAVLICAPASPVQVQGWQLLLALPAACLPVAGWIAGVWPRGRPWLRAALVVFLFWRLPAVLVLGWGHPMYATPERPDDPRHMVPEVLRPLFPAPGPADSRSRPADPIARRVTRRDPGAAKATGARPPESKVRHSVRRRSGAFSGGAAARAARGR